MDPGYAVDPAFADIVSSNLHTASRLLWVRTSSDKAKKPEKNSPCFKLQSFRDKNMLCIV